MSNILIMAPTAISALTMSRGTGGDNLLRPDPLEVWLDNAVGTAATIDIDFGVARVIDTVFLGCILSPLAGASWTISGGLAGYADAVIKPASDLRVPDRAGRFATMSHALWHGADEYFRYLRISVTQPGGGAPLSVGVLMAGMAFVPGYNNEWGAGRAVKDTGSLTRLPSGGAAIVEGARYGSYRWSLADLSTDETDALYEMQLDRGETRPVLVVEDPDVTAGLRNRIRYGLLTSLRPFERRNPRQTRWEFTIEDLGSDDAAASTASLPLLTLGGIPLLLGTEILTIGV